jgi:hypothetical protein
LPAASTRHSQLCSNVAPFAQVGRKLLRASDADRLLMILPEADL